MEIKDDDFSLSLSYRSIDDNGSISLERSLAQLKIEGVPCHPFADFVIVYDFNESEKASEFIDELIKLYRNTTKKEIKNKLVELLKYYKENNIKMSLSKEKLLFISKVYDYDKEDMDFSEDDFYNYEDEQKENHIEVFSLKKETYKTITDKYWTQLQEIRNEWDKDFSEYNKMVASKVYNSIDELKEDFKIISKKQDNVQRSLNKLILNLDNEIIKSKYDDNKIYNSVLKLLNEIKNNLDDFTLELGLTGKSNEELGEYTISLNQDSIEIINKYEKKYYDSLPEKERKKIQEEKEKHNKEYIDKRLKKIKYKIKEIQNDKNKKKKNQNNKEKEKNKKNKKNKKKENDNKKKKKRITELDNEKSKLGLFKISEKKKINEEISRINSEIELNEEKIAEIKNNKELEILNNKLLFISADKGDILKFGKDPINGELINWIVLNKDIDGILVLSKYTIDMTRYTSSEDWLKRFERNAFDEEIRKMFVKNGNRFDVSTNVFFLSEDEIKKFLGNNVEADATPQLEEREVNSYIDNCMKGTPQSTIDRLVEDAKREVKEYWVRGIIDRNGFANFVGKKADSDEYFVSIIGAGAKFAARPAILLKITDEE